MKKWPIVFWILIGSIVICAQNNTQSKTDSLRRELQRSNDDTNKIKILRQLAYDCSKQNFNEGIQYANQAIRLAEKFGWKHGLASLHVALGLNYAAKCEYPAAALNYKKAEDLYHKAGDKEGLSSVYANLALMYMVQSEYGKALETNFKALSLFEELNNVQKKAIVLENIGTIYLERGNYEKALGYYSESLRNYKSIHDKDGVARNLANQGIILNTQGHYEKALRYHLQALHINQERNDLSSLQINYANVGVTHTYLKNYERALHHHHEALNISRRLNDLKNIAINLGNIGEVYFFMAKNEPTASKRNALLLTATKQLKEAIERCKAINFNGPCIEFCDFHYQTLQLAGDHKGALLAFKEYTLIKDSVFSAQSRLTIAELESKRALELKNKDLVLQERQLEIERLKVINRNNERLLFIGAIVLLCAFIFWMYQLYRRRIRRQKKLLSDIAHIQSHQVRAPLARILGLAQLFDHHNTAASINKDVVTKMYQSALELDTVVRNTVNKASEDRSKGSL